MSAEEWHFFQFREILLYWVKNFLITERFYASVLLSLAHTHLHLCLWLYCMWMCRQPSLSSIIHLWRLFNSRRSPACLFPPRVALCSAQLSLSCFFLLYFSFPPLFTLMSAFLSCLKPFILSCTHPPLTTNPHPPPSLPLYISSNLEVSHLYSWLDKKWVCLSSFFLPPPSTLLTLLHHCSSHQTISSHVRETCRHPSATFDHCFCWESSSPCSALGW